jgi:hypothetical protein
MGGGINVIHIKSWNEVLARPSTLLSQKYHQSLHGTVL